MGANNKFINLECLENNPDELFELLDDVGSDLEIEENEEETGNFDISYFDEQKIFFSKEPLLDQIQIVKTTYHYHISRKHPVKRVFFSQNQIL
ncbi:hypothetical protein JTB14_010385 [Gonioctena quinquepunctata]|nr:hypothetical protein JTB14_010385 [Gonioctena quinquepunctata]